jgi:hypothetical protein
LAIAGIVVLLSVLAWFDKAECEGVADSGGSRHVALVVDRSGSMEFLVADVINNVNAVIDSLPPADRVSILFFESPFGVVRYVENQPVDNVRPLTFNDYFPIGGTPLYDAIGVAIRDIVTPTLGTVGGADQGILIVLSDGEENTSMRFSLDDARAAVQAALDLGVDIRFYGMGPAATYEASALGIPLSNTVQVSQTAEGLNEAFEDVQRSLSQGATERQC